MSWTALAIAGISVAAVHSRTRITIPIRAFAIGSFKGFFSSGRFFGETDLSHPKISFYHPTVSLGRSSYADLIRALDRMEKLLIERAKKDREEEK